MCIRTRLNEARHPNVAATELRIPALGFTLKLSNFLVFCVFVYYVLQLGRNPCSAIVTYVQSSSGLPTSQNAREVLNAGEAAILRFLYR